MPLQKHLSLSLQYRIYRWIRGLGSTISSPDKKSGTKMTSPPTYRSDLAPFTPKPAVSPTVYRVPNIQSHVHLSLGTTMQGSTKSCNRPIRARYLVHVTGNQPITDQYILIRSVHASLPTGSHWTRTNGELPAAEALPQLDRSRHQGEVL